MFVFSKSQELDLKNLMIYFMENIQFFVFYRNYLENLSTCIKLQLPLQYIKHLLFSTIDQNDITNISSKFVTALLKI